MSDDARSLIAPYPALAREFGEEFVVSAVLGCRKAGRQGDVYLDRPSLFRKLLLARQQQVELRQELPA